MFFLLRKKESRKSSYNMRIAILLPKETAFPIGGYKVVYEYANYLVSKGDEVYILYFSSYNFIKYGIKEKLWIIRYHIKAIYKKTFLSSLWFHLDSRIRECRVLYFNRLLMPKCDAYIATAIKTAIELNRIESINNSKKFYFIQGFENWSLNGDNNSVCETYKYRMTKIVVSKWLKYILDNMGEVSYLIPNGFDFTSFNTYVPVEQRNPHRLVYMYHLNPQKGADIAFKAFELVKKCIPDLHVTIFSVYSKPDGLPQWYSFYQQPNQSLLNEIYNNAAIYVGSSSNEGWGLTVGEAMICGCAVVCTDNKGYLEMAVDGDNALVVPVGDSEKMAEAIIKLVHDDELRIRLAENGHKGIQRFNWENSFIKFRDVLHSVA